MSDGRIPQNDIFQSYSIEIAVREETGATSDDGSASLPPRLCGHLDGRFVNALSNIGLLYGRLQSSRTENIFDRHCCVRTTNQSQATNAGVWTRMLRKRETRTGFTVYICHIDEAPHNPCLRTRNMYGCLYKDCNKITWARTVKSVHGIH